MKIQSPDHPHSLESETDLGGFIRSLANNKDFGGFVHHERIPEKKPDFGKSEKITTQILAGLSALGIPMLYSHQVEGIEHVFCGRNVIVATPTASGKTLVYNVPVLQTVLENRETKALYLYPLKALEQDQLGALTEFAEALGLKGSETAAIYDGDVSAYRKKKIRDNPPNIVLSNPDMLHASLLPYHDTWAAFFRNLKFVVLDELHSYRGIFGSHIAQIMKRLHRVCETYGSNPQFISCSASVSNAKEFAERLIHKPFQVVSQNGSPRPGGNFLFYNPSVTSPYTDASRLFRQCIRRNLKTIAFTKSRKITELLHSWTIQAEPGLAGRISSYRSGFLPEERRAIEQSLFSGELDGVISTSALELGIDVGGLDACLLVGYPGTITATWQRGGRVGRGEREFLIILIAQPDALDQYFMKHPNDFFNRKFEAAVIDPNNPFILRDHIPCAAAELSIDENDPYFDPLGNAEIFRELESQNRLARSASENRWFSFQKNPQRDVDIRMVGENFTILESATKRVVGQVGGSRVFDECHNGAIYLHKARQYLVLKLDLEKKNVYVKPVNDNFYTHTLKDKETEILEVLKSRPVKNFILKKGRLKVTSATTGYEKRKIFGQEKLGTYELDLPPQVFETVGFWIEIDDGIKRAVQNARLDYMGGIHALEHAAISMFPLLALCDRDDIGGISYPQHPQVQKSAIFFYDGYPGGIGLCDAGFETIESLLESTYRLILDCPCEEGCPSCIHSPKCGSGNKPLDKKAAQLTLEFLMGEKPIPETGGEGPEPADRSLPEKVPVQTKAPRFRIQFMDIETQRSAEEVGGWNNKHLMKMAVGVVYDSLDGKYHTYFENQVDQMLKRMFEADLVVGFNHVGFDYPVLQAYSVKNLMEEIHSFDILDDIKKRLGFRLKLNDLAKDTLNVEKLADGLQSLEWFKTGEMDKIVEYCIQDVKVTKELFEFGCRNGHLVYTHRSGEKVRLPVDWSVEGLSKK